MKTSFQIVKFRGISIRVHLTFALVLLWAMLDWGVGRGLGLAGALYGLALISLLFVSVTLHELGHSLVARRYGVEVRDIVLLPIGGMARIDGEITRPAHEFWMALSGPAVNVGIAMVLGAIVVPVGAWRALAGWSVLLRVFRGVGFERLLLDLLIANVGLAIFNLVPAFPMDGGRVLRAVLASRIGIVKATRVAVRVGQALAVVMGLAGLLGGGINLTLIALFIFSGAAQEWRAMQVRSALEEVPASAALMAGDVVLSPTDLLSRAIDVSLQGRQSDFAVMDRGALAGVLTREDVAGAFTRFGAGVLVGRVMRTDLPVARANASLFDLQRQLKSSGSSAISVFDSGGQFLGLVTWGSVGRALRLNAAHRSRPGRA